MVYFERKKMINKDQYLDQLLGHILPLQEKILAQEKTRDDVCPSVGKALGRLLYLLILSSRAKRVLEVGTSSGYSAIWMGLALDQIDGQLTTIESHQRLVDEAQDNIKQAGLSRRVRFISGQAQELLPSLEGPFDLIFQDAGTQAYPETLGLLTDLLAPGGLLVADDVLFALWAKRDRPRQNMEAFNQALFKQPALFSTLLDFSDGISISIKR